MQTFHPSWITLFIFLCVNHNISITNALQIVQHQQQHFDSFSSPPHHLDFQHSTSSVHVPSYHPLASTLFPHETSPLQQYLSLFLVTNNLEDTNISPPPAAFHLINNKSIKKETDEVVRIIDANTIKLQRSGLVTLAAVQTPSGYNESNFRFPDCFTKSPSSKLRQLLPKGTKVTIAFVEENMGSGSRPRAAFIEVNEKASLVNVELVREGFAKPVSRGRAKTEEIMPGLSNYLLSLQQDAKENGLGIYKRCEDIENIANDDQFEPMDVETEIQFGDDGGKEILKFNEKNKEQVVPPNPGDKRGCSDFRTYEDALRYYETYYPYYGDVAKLDRDGDGIPCSGLPHTTNQSKYRVKKATFQVDAAN